MAFIFTRNTMELRDIYKKFNVGEYIIDDSYQRRKVWTEKDNIRLIETILLNLVIPEIFLWPSEIDHKTGDTITHIVDGQQRINAIVEFLSGAFCLKKAALISNEISDNYGNLYFDNLPIEVKKSFWSYKLSIVDIDRNCSKDDIKDMFYRLNITDYKLNEQEIRHSLNTVFGQVALDLSRQGFWDDIGVFSSSDVKRMKDVEYCASILLLADEGILDQTTSKRLNQAYDDYKDEFPETELILDLISKAIDNITFLKQPSNEKFLNKKIQLYTTFCLMFYLEEHQIPLNTTLKERFNLFVNTYVNFKNDISETDVPDHIRNLFKLINSYRLASSEGVNKLSNRMLRFEIMKKTCLLTEEFPEELFEDLTIYLKNL
ncbi:DUF262 domain-containing protein [Solibacillus sp. FSL R7-0668]|uniref:DUF262 domain-containing protein n=1 Tax=Solibacillus sp. FSL R7-0668 TaxID=2921688 RepID=UPI0030F68D43